MRKELVIATSNKGKINEFKTLFAGMYEVKSLLDYPQVPEIIEDGDTFKANAAKKSGNASSLFKSKRVSR